MTRDFLRSPFMAFCVAALVIFAYSVAVIPKGELVILINEHHNPILDQIFKYITHLGDGATMAVLLVGLLFVSYKLSMLAAFSIIFQSIIVSLFKRWLYKGLPRPTAFVEGFDWHFIDGVDVHATNTFPSGHTTTAFALFGLMAVIFANRGYFLNLIFFLLAYSVGFSRVYLLQHFVVDAYFGALFGVLSVVLSLLLMEKLFSENKLNKLHQNSLRGLWGKSL